MRASKRTLLIATILVLNVAVAMGANIIWDSLRQPAVAAVKAVPPSPPLTEEEKIIRLIAKASPSVVSILIQQHEPKSQTIIIDGNGTRVQENEGELQEVGRGTGFIVRQDGIIITNRHVAFSRAATYTVFLSDERKFDAKIMDMDPVSDLAILKIEAKGLPVLELEPKDDPRIGQTVIAVGNALGKYANTVTRGILSGMNRSLDATNERTGEEETLEDVLQTDAAINSGNSGGPLLNLDGKVIGVNTAVEKGGQGLGFAIPVFQVRKALDTYYRLGIIARPRMGLRYVQITPEHVLKLGLKHSEGAIIHALPEQGPAVLPGTPAERAGLRAGQVIIEVNGEKVRGKRTLSRIVQGYNVGDVLKLKIGNDDGSIFDTWLQLEAHEPVRD